MDSFCKKKLCLVTRDLRSNAIRLSHSRGLFVYTCIYTQLAINMFGFERNNAAPKSSLEHVSASKAALQASDNMEIITAVQNYLGVQAAIDHGYNESAGNLLDGSDRDTYTEKITQLLIDSKIHLAEGVSIKDFVDEMDERFKLKRTIQ